MGKLYLKELDLLIEFRWELMLNFANLEEIFLSSTSENGRSDHEHLERLHRAWLSRLCNELFLIEIGVQSRVW